MIYITQWLKVYLSLFTGARYTKSTVSKQECEKNDMQVSAASFSYIQENELYHQNTLLKTESNYK